MESLFEFDLPRPLSAEAERVLREQLGMRRHQRVSFFDGIATPWPNSQVLLIAKDDNTYTLQAKSCRPIGEEIVRRWRSSVAQIAKQAGSQDPRIEQAIQRQAPRVEALGAKNRSRR